MERVCFSLQVRPDCLDEYKRRHQNVWADMREALSSTGWHDYSLFLRDDGLLIGYLLTPNFQEALDKMAATGSERTLATRDEAVLRRAGRSAGSGDADGWKKFFIFLKKEY